MRLDRAGRSRTFLRWAAASAILCAAPACRRRKPPPEERVGDEIVVAGRMFHTGTPVVLWSDPGGYDAYRETCFFVPDRVMPSSKTYRGGPKRYGVRNPGEGEIARRVREKGWTLENLRDFVHLFVIHYDACGTSKRCFRVLHDGRGLSVHFMLDLDGTIYQTLDLRERARHAGLYNSRSIGIEIANIGAYADGERLEKWYRRDGDGRLRVVLPADDESEGIRTPGFVARPARQELVEGEIHGKRFRQYDYTPEQYEALARLTAALHRIFPLIRLDAPRDEEGRVRTDVLSRTEILSFGGLVGHLHISSRKIDPGPAFDWEGVLRNARRIYRETSGARRSNR